MDVPHGARQQHSTSAPAAGPFSSDFNESFMIIRPLAPRRPAAGGEVLPPAPRAALSPAAPRARRRGEVFPRPLPAPRFSPCRRPARCRPRRAIPTVVAGRARAALFPLPPPRALPPALPPAPPRETSWQAHHLSGIMIALSIDGTPGGNGGEHLRQHGGTRRGRLRRRGDARCAPRHSAAAARLPARNRAGVRDRKNQRGKPTCAL